MTKKLPAVFHRPQRVHLNFLCILFFRSYLLSRSFYISLDLASLILAVRALQNLVGTAPETFRMSRVYDFPADQHHTRGKE